MSGLSRTSHSFYSQHSSPSKINFQTKYKIRGTNQIVPNHHHQQIKNYFNPLNISTNQNDSTRNHYLIKNQAKNPFNQTCKSLLKTNFNHHDSERCLCNQCLCGRHYCKLHVVKPDLRKSSTYQSNFRRAKSILNNRVVQKQYDNSLPKVQMNSTYTFSFKDKDPNVVIKHHPQDQLNFNGPAQKLTSYRVHYPGNRGNNPYVRPKQMYASGEFPFKNKLSSYKQSFINGNKIGKNESGKINDQLKIGKMNIFGESFYQQKFRSPNPQDYNPISKIHQKLQINPGYTHQYESIYQNDFIPTQPVLCPAKIKLQTKYKDTLNNSKNNFNQNSDFKSFNSTLQTLSRSPVGHYM